MGAVLFRLTLLAGLFIGTNQLTYSKVTSVWPYQSSVAINKIMADAGTNDTILFRKGHYFVKNLIIGKKVFISGENYPVLDGSNHNQVMVIGASGVTVTGFRIINIGVSDLNELSGIRIQNSRAVVIKNNIFENVFFGIYCSNTTACLIVNNTITSSFRNEIQSGNGIHCWKCDSMIISNNSLQGQRDGIYFEFVTNSRILFNNSHNNLRYGLHFMFSHNNLYKDNTFSGNGAGVAVMYSHRVTMIGNTFTLNQGESSYGILMKDISDSYVSGNLFSSNTIGIYMEGTSRIKVENNTFSSNGWAFRMQASCDDITVNRNKFIGNTFDVATNGNLVLNKFEMNYWDKYEGYDMNKDGVGDVPYRPVSLYSVIAERMPYSIMLFRSFMVMLLERTERAVPGLTPVDMKDDKPLMKPFVI